jgi:hypothetical protein
MHPDKRLASRFFEESQAFFFASLVAFLESFFGAGLAAP